MMTSRYWIPYLLALGLLQAGCDNHPAPATPAKSEDPQTLEMKLIALVKRAEGGDATSQASLGRMYLYGEGVPADKTKGLDWLQKAALQGNASAQLHLGITLFDDDPTKAGEWLSRAAEQGNATAQGTIFAQGIGVPKDIAKAVESLQKGSAQGDSYAEYLLGRWYAEGYEGLGKDSVKAVEWLQKAGAHGHVQAQYELGDIYSGGKGVPKDSVKAAEWYRRAADQGNAWSQFALGEMYARGDGVTQDADKATEWFDRAVKGNKEYLDRLGDMYNAGLYVPKDPAKALEWYQKAAAAGNARIQIELGWLYWIGEQTPKDFVLAYAWLNLASGSSDQAYAKNASEARDTLAKEKMNAADIAEAQRLSSNWKPGRILSRGSEKGANKSSQPVRRSSGTGFLISGSGHAITNEHVIKGCKEVHMSGRDGIVKVLTKDAVNDLALLQVEGEFKDTAVINPDPTKLRQGDEIFVYGFPLNTVISSDGNLTPGVVSALAGISNNTNVIQITAPIQPGSSGSPVMNKKGDVVAVVSSQLSDKEMAAATGQIAQNVNFAVNGQTLRLFLDNHKVPYNSGGRFFTRDKSAADIAEEARKWTFLVECWR